MDWRAVPGDPLQGIALFAGLDARVRRRLVASSTPRAYREGQLLFKEGDPGDALIVMRSGVVAVFRSGPGRDRAVLTVVRAPDVLGEVSLLDGAPRSASVEAVERTEVLALSRTAFLDVVHSDEKLMDEVFRGMGSMIRRLTEQKTDYIFLDLPGRVAKTLVRLLDTERDADSSTVHLSQSRVAELVGGSRQSINHVIRTFAHRGWLRTEGRRIVLTDLPALRHRAGLPTH